MQKIKRDAGLPLCAITPFSMLDFPDRLSCIFWFSGCNMACPYCYNVEFLTQRGMISEDSALDFLQTRKNLLEGVVLSGGEASLYANLKEFCKKIKSLGFLIKLDTNGTNPRVLKNLIKHNLLDYVSLDFKAPKEKAKIFGVKNLFSLFIDSLYVLLESNIEFSVRTTLHSDILDNQDISRMRNILESCGYNGVYFLQHFVSDKHTLKPLGTHDRNIYRQYKNISFTN